MANHFRLSYSTFNSSIRSYIFTPPHYIQWRTKHLATCMTGAVIHAFMGLVITSNVPVPVYTDIECPACGSHYVEVQ